jgi:hypothetical protein
LGHSNTELAAAEGKFLRKTMKHLLLQNKRNEVNLAAS